MIDLTDMLKRLSAQKSILREIMNQVPQLGPAIEFDALRNDMWALRLRRLARYHDGATPASMLPSWATEIAHVWKQADADCPETVSRCVYAYTCEIAERYASLTRSAQQLYGEEWH